MWKKSFVFLAGILFYSATAIGQIITNQSYHTGLDFLHKGKYDFAIYDFTKAIEAEKVLDAYFWRGVCYFRLEKYEKALEDFNHVLAANDKYLDAYIYRAKTYCKLDKLRDGVADFSKAYALDTANVEILKDRVLVYNQLGEYQLAITDLKRLILKTPNYPENYASLGALQLKVADYAGAVVSLTSALEMDKKESDHQDPELFFNRGLARLEIRDTVGACEDFLTAGNMGNAAALDKSQEVCASAKK